MGKMTLGGKQGRRRRDGGPVERGAKLRQLHFRERQEEALEKDNGFAEAGVEVVMGGVKKVPLLFGSYRGRIVQLFSGAGAGFIEILDELQEGGDFMKKLRTLTKKDATANSVETCGSAALGLLKIFGIQRTEIGSHAKVLCMREHGAEKIQKRVG
jgi:hypothetical protein